MHSVYYDVLCSEVLIILLSISQMERVDYSNVLKMAEMLQRKTAYTPAYVHLVSLLYHCLLIPGE